MKTIIIGRPELELHPDKLLDIKLLSSHMTPVIPDCPISEHEHPHWELSFMISGSMTNFCGGEKIFCSAENLKIFLVPPGVSHRRIFGSSDENCNLTLNFQFSAASQDDVLFQYCREHRFAFEAEDFLRSMVKAIKSECQHSLTEVSWVLPNMIQTFLLLFLRDILKVSGSSSDTAALYGHRFNTAAERADLIYQYLVTQISTPALLQKLSSNFSLSLKQINRILKTYRGCSVAEARHRIRCEQARYLLLSSKMMIHEISAVLGFRTAAGFYSFFRRAFNCTPNEFRETQSSAVTFHSADHCGSEEQKSEK